MAHLGGSVILTTAMQRLDQGQYHADHLEIRAHPANLIAYFGNSTTNVTGYILAGEAKQFANICPRDIYVKGTANNLLYWDADGSQMSTFQS